MLMRGVITLLALCSVVVCSVQAIADEFLCDPGFAHYKGYCLKALHQKQTRLQIKDRCSALDSNLFDIKTWEDQRIIEFFIEAAEIDDGPVWLIGEIGRSSRIAGAYIVYWPATAPVRFRLNNFENRSDLQTGDGKCLVVKSRKARFYWSRFPCNSKAYGICVKEAMKSEDWWKRDRMQ